MYLQLWNDTMYTCNYFLKRPSGELLHTLSKLYDVPVRSPRGGCCSISDDLPCSCKSFKHNQVIRILRHSSLTRDITRWCYVVIIVSINNIILMPQLLQCLTDKNNCNILSEFIFFLYFYILDIFCALHQTICLTVDENDFTCQWILLYRADIRMRGKQAIEAMLEGYRDMKNFITQVCINVLLRF